MSDVTTWYAVAALGVTTVGGVLTNYLGRGRRQEIEVAEVPDELAGADLSSEAGVIAVVIQLSQQVAELRSELTGTQARVAAQGRYQRLLVATIDTMGGTVPQPDPDDVPLIRG